MYCEERCTFGFCIGLFNFCNPGVSSYSVISHNASFFLSLSQSTGHLLNTRFYLKSQCLLTNPHVHFSHFHFPLLSELHSFYFYPLLHFLFSFPSQFTVCSFWGWLKNFTRAPFIFLFHLVLLLWLPTMFRICTSRILRLFSEERNTYFPDFGFIVDRYGGVRLCRILTMLCWIWDHSFSGLCPISVFKIKIITLHCGYRTCHCHQVKRKVLFSKRHVLILILSTALVEVQNQLLFKPVDLRFIEVFVTAFDHSY